MPSTKRSASTWPLRWLSAAISGREGVDAGIEPATSGQALIARRRATASEGARRLTIRRLPGARAWPLSVQARMPRWSPGPGGWTKRRRDSAAVMAPPWPPAPTLLRSATFESRTVAAYGRRRAAMRQSGSLLGGAVSARVHRRGRPSSVVSGARRRMGPSATRAAPVSVGKIDDQRRPVFVGQRERIGKDQTALRIGIANFDRNAFARNIDVARAEAGARDRVLLPPEL